MSGNVYRFLLNSINYAYKKNKKVLVTKYKNNTIVAWRGSNSLNDIVNALDIRYKDPCNKYNLPCNLKIHSGALDFMDNVNVLEINKILKDDDNIIFCGHSMGSVACIIQASVYKYNNKNKNVKVITFGGIPVGDDNFVEWFDNLDIDVERILVGADISNFYYAPNYRHIGEKIHLKNDKMYNIWKSIDHHNLNSYMDEVDTLN